ncbi:MAG: methyltransferase domain-containing protein, partial [Gammaproteobacteria bacterium]
NRPLRVLDIGGGDGRMSAWLAGQGHEVIYSEPAEAMRTAALRRFRVEGVLERIEVLDLPLQALAPDTLGCFDLVLLHAVLEWLAEPAAGLAHAESLVGEGGWLSVLFYNRHSIVIRNLLLGNFRKVASGELSGHPGGLTPKSPLDPEEVRQWLRLPVRHQRGIRCFTDYLDADLRKRRSYEDILELEQRLGTRMPYRDMARYLHLLAGGPC